MKDCEFCLYAGNRQDCLAIGTDSWGFDDIHCYEVYYLKFICQHLNYSDTSSINYIIG
jgi:hypothetical protein